MDTREKFFEKGKMIILLMLFVKINAREKFFEKEKDDNFIAYINSITYLKTKKLKYFFMQNNLKIQKRFYKF